MKLKIFSLLALVTIMICGCQDEEKNKVVDFAKDFGVMVMQNNSKAIATVYPEAAGQSVGFSSSVTDFQVDDKNSFGIWRVHYGDGSWIDVKQNSDGSFFVVDSQGILGGGSNNASSSTSNLQASQTSQPEKLSVSNVSDGPNGRLSNQAGNSYSARNLFDGKSSTGWAVRLYETNYSYDNYLYGPSFDVAGSKIDKIVIRNGYHKNSDSFNKNTRASWIRIYRGSNDEPSRSDILYEGSLSDSRSAQTLKVNPDFDQSRPFNNIHLAFSSEYDDRYYHGSKWDDLVISELEFWGSK